MSLHVWETKLNFFQSVLTFETPRRLSSEADIQFHNEQINTFHRQTPSNEYRLAAWQLERKNWVGVFIENWKQAILSEAQENKIKNKKYRRKTNYTVSSSFRRASTAFSLSATNSSRYWYRSFLRARHSRALCRLRSVKHKEHKHRY